MISLGEFNFEDGRVAWNHTAYDYYTLVEWLDRPQELIPPPKLHQIFLRYQQMYDGLLTINSDQTQEVVNDILSTLPPLTEEEEDYGYLNHLAIYKLELLINIVYRQKNIGPKVIMDLLSELVSHANQSNADCFQVSVNFACKFFAKVYPSHAGNIHLIRGSLNYYKQWDSR